MLKRVAGAVVFFSAALSCLPLLRAQDTQQPSAPPDPPAAGSAAPLPPRGEETPADPDIGRARTQAA